MIPLSRRGTLHLTFTAPGQYAAIDARAAAGDFVRGDGWAPADDSRFPLELAVPLTFGAEVADWRIAKTDGVIASFTFVKSGSIKRLEHDAAGQLVTIVEQDA